MKTVLPKKSDITRTWHIVDAKGKVLGKVATKVAEILRGKHKAIFTPHLDTGDAVIVINAKDVVLTGSKLSQKKYYRSSGYSGSVKEISAEKLLAKDPKQVLEKAISGMIPHNRLKKGILQRLKIYKGDEHAHAAQSPKILEIS